MENEKMKKCTQLVMEKEIMYRYIFWEWKITGQIVYTTRIQGKRLLDINKWKSKNTVYSVIKLLFVFLTHRRFSLKSK